MKSRFYIAVFALLGEYSPTDNYIQDYTQHYTQAPFFKRNVPFYLLPYPTIYHLNSTISKSPFNW